MAVASQANRLPGPAPTPRTAHTSGGAYHARRDRRRLSGERPALLRMLPRGRSVGDQPRPRPLEVPMSRRPLLLLLTVPALMIAGAPAALAGEDDSTTTVTVQTPPPPP